MAQIEDLQRPCERWYAERESEFIGRFGGQFIVMSYFEKSEMIARGLGHIATNWPVCSESRPYVVSQKALEAMERFEAQFGDAGSYCRRIGDPVMDF
jgi:hypothetical protein